MNHTARKQLIVYLFPLLLFGSGCQLAKFAAPFIISKIIVIGSQLKPHVVAAFIERLIDAGFKAIFDLAAGNTADAIQSEIVPIDGKGLFGRKLGDHEYKVLGDHQNGGIDHTIKIKTTEILFQRANEFSRWVLTPDSRDLISERLAVASAQVSLDKYGYKPGNVDGKWGPNTSGAVTRFQEDYSLPVTGQLDDVTKEYLLKR